MANLSSPIGVIGTGTMGGGIAQWAAQCGFEVLVRDANPLLAAQGVEYIRSRLARLVQRGKSTQEDADAAFARIATAVEASELADCAVIIEAVVEDLETKCQVFRELDAVNPAGLLATNTSALSVTRIAEACREPARVVGLHFFNPPTVMPLVEVVRAEQTADASIKQATEFVHALRKTPVPVKDTPGFIVNRVMRPFYLEALRILGEGQARVEEIDAAVRDLGFRMGPFELVDLIGLDVNLATSRNIYEATERADFRPHPIQEQLVAEARLGRKTRSGFYQYDQEGRKVAAAPLPASGGSMGEQVDGRLTREEIQQRILRALVAEAERVVEESTAGREDIATALKLGANWPKSPWEWQEPGVRGSRV